MHEVTIRFRLVKEDRIVEARLDTRLSFAHNLKLLGELIGFDLEHALVYDAEKKIFLDRNIILAKFNIGYIITLHLFT